MAANTDPEIVFRYPANWTLVAALVLGVVVGAVFVHFFTEETTDAGNH